MKNILITGHNGFVGTHLVSHLSKKYSLFGVSISSNPSKIKQIKKDVRKLNIDDIPKNISYIIHLAAVSDIAQCQENPAKCFSINVAGTQNLLELSRKTNSKLLFVSSSHVYGKPKKIPIDENHPTKPSSIYSASKIACEILCESYANSYGLDISILRLFSVYGPNSPHHLVIHKIISQIIHSNSIKLGNLFPKRDFIYIDDVISAINLVLKKSKGFNIYNVGSGKSYSILEICNFLKKITNKNFEVKSIKSLSRKNEVKNVVCNSNKIKKLGWKPKTSIQMGLEKTFEYHVS